MKVHELPFNDTIKADFELIMRRVLSKFPAAKIYTIPDADLAEIHGATPSLAATVGLQHKTVSLLLKFRDAFVHNGSIAAVQLQLQLLSLPQKELDTLQEITGVKLNIGRSPL